jgi:tetratricopeptide (TPR) repeat protein
MLNATLAAALVALAPVPAQTAEPQLGPLVVQHFDLLQSLVEQKDYDALLRQIDALMPRVAPESYDRAVLSKLHAQVLLSFTPPRYADAIPALETAVLLGDTHGYFDATATLDSLGTLSQLYYEISTATKDATLRRPRLRAAYTHVAHWIERVPNPFATDATASAFSPKVAVASQPATPVGTTQTSSPPDPDAPPAPPTSATDGASGQAPPPVPAASLAAQVATAHLYAATLLYTEATLEPATPDVPTLHLAARHAHQSLVLRPRADEPTLVLLLSIRQQLYEHTAAAELLETLVARDPANLAYWQQLIALYITLAADGKHPPSLIRRHRIRALLTLGRAHAAGHPLTPQDQYNRIALLTALHQYPAAIALLETALADGSIAPTAANWELLANLYQYQRNPDLAATALERALRHHPDNPELHHALARAHYAAARPAAALAALERAVQGKLERPAEAWALLAYLGYELRRFDDAAHWLDTAFRQPHAKLPELHSLRSAIESARQLPAQK